MWSPVYTHRLCSAGFWEHATGCSRVACGFIHLFLRRRVAMRCEMFARPVCFKCACSRCACMMALTITLYYLERNAYQEARTHTNRQSQSQPDKHTRSFSHATNQCNAQHTTTQHIAQSMSTTHTRSPAAQVRLERDDCNSAASLRDLRRDRVRVVRVGVLYSILSSVIISYRGYAKMRAHEICRFLRASISVYICYAFANAADVSDAV